MIKLALAAIAVLTVGGTAFAEPQVYRLSPAQIEAAKAEAALRPEAPGRALLPSADRDTILENSLYGEGERSRKVHGEVGMFIGTGGARGIYGTTAVPLGETGMAQFSFETSQFGNPYRGRR